MPPCYNVGMERIELEDFLLAAEAVLGIDAADLLQVTNVSLAESALAAPFATYGGQDFYPEPAVRAAILCSRIVRNHALPDGNKRVGLVLMLAYLDEQGLSWHGPDQDEIADMIERLAGKEPTVSEAEFTDWVCANVS